MIAFALAALLSATPVNLTAQLKAAQPGDTLVLAGDFGMVKVYQKQGLTLDASQATFTRLMVAASQDITVKGGKYRPMDWSGAIYVGDSQRVTIQSVDIVGDRQWNGVTFINSRDVALIGARVEAVKSGAVVRGTVGATLKGNAFLAEGADGMDVIDSSNVLLEANSCSGGLLVAGYHPDCVQYYGAIDGLTVRGNLVHGPTQGISAFGPGVRSNVTIEGNVLAITYPQAISAGGVTNLVVRNNRVSTLPGAAFQAAIRVEGLPLTRCGNLVAPAAGKPGVTDPACTE